MDRVRAQSVIGGGAMRVGGIGAVDVLLRAGGQERRELEVDAGDRRAVPQAAVLRLAADDGLAPGGGGGGREEKGGAGGGGGGGGERPQGRGGGGGGGKGGGGGPGGQTGRMTRV